MLHIEIRSEGLVSSIEYEEMFGCLPRIGFRSERAMYEYPKMHLAEVCRFEVMCQLRYAGMDIYELAELPKRKGNLPDLWYFGL
jgi:hypothetical protein